MTRDSRLLALFFPMSRNADRQGVNIGQYAEIQFITSMIHKNVSENEILEIVHKARLVSKIWTEVRNK